MNCAICGAKLKKSQKVVCSKQCLAQHLSAKYRGKGKSPYIQIRVNGKRIYLHRWIWEKANGRSLVEGEIVHHINEDKRDNHPSNLEVMSGRAAHLHVHNYHKNNRSECKEDFTDFGW